jgi:hypothetical protein
MSIDTIKSAFNLATFEIVKSGNGFFPALTISNPGAGLYNYGTATTTVAHGLGFVPTILGYITDVSTGKNYIAPHTPYSVPSASTAAWYNMQIYGDKTNLYIFSWLTVYGASFSIAASAYQYQFYLLRDKGKRLV